MYGKKPISVRVDEDDYKKIQNFIKKETDWSNKNKKLPYYFTFTTIVEEAMCDFMKKYGII